MSPIPNSTGNDEWGTPLEVLDFVQSYYGPINLDLAARDQRMAVVPLYVGPGRQSEGWTDGLTWSPEAWTAPTGSHVWVNCPYSRAAGGLEAWCRKMYETSLAGYRVTGLFFSRTETKAWHEYVDKASQVWFIRRRLKFLDPETGQPRHPAPAPSVLVHWSRFGPFTMEDGRPQFPPTDYRNLDLQAWAEGFHTGGEE